MIRYFDSLIEEARGLLSGCALRRLPEGGPWRDVGKNNLVLRGDMAYELGGGTLPAVSFLGVSEDAALEPGVFLCGPDLPELRADAPYARLAFLRVRPGERTEEAEYQLLRQLEYVRYRVNPWGFMPRISAASHREPVRVSRAALGEGLRFDRVGRLYMDACRAEPAVESAQIVFVTDADFPFSELARLSERVEQTTKALDHLLRDFKMDCATCELQKVCAEVEVLRKKQK